jgi:Asp-tRNA(Asn)/Glu-tRNA(Gln) amidotransferase A subunit family amidase
VDRLTAPALLGPTTDALRSGTLPLDTYLDGVSRRIEAVEPTIRALVPEHDRRRRLAAEAEVAAPGPLAQIPVGIKDVFHVAGMETRAGSRLDPVTLAGRQGTVVDRLRDAGALVLGKTVTAEFAFSDPGPTTNPHDPTRTPGGSSSGSAAAVAAGYTPLAIGTQTVDSTITPASYCGVVGFKPTGGRAPLDGCIPFSPAMDHLGIFAQDVAGIAIAAAVVCDDWVPAAPVHRPVLAVPVGRYLQRATAATRNGFRSWVDDLEAGGAAVVEVPVLDDFEEVYRGHYRFIAYEFAQVHTRWFGSWGYRYGDGAAGLFRKGAALDPEVVGDGLRSSADLRSRLHGALDDVGADAWVAPAATGPAPPGLASIGDPAMGLPWTHARVPAITLPARRVDDMPVGIQLAGRAGADEALLSVAGWIEIALATA